MSDLIQNPWAAIEDKADPSIPTATHQIYSFIESYLDRQKDTHVNRASSATACFMKRWFQRNGFEGKGMAPRAMVNFLQGDLAERTMLYFITQACVGPGKIYSEVNLGEVLGSIQFQGKELKIYKQEHLTADMDGIEITAHVDGWGKRNSDGQWELIECKSAANWGYGEFKKSGPGEYIKQAHACFRTTKAKQLGVKSVRYFYLRKETGHLWDRVHNFDPEIDKEVVAEFHLSNQTERPLPPYRPVAEMNRSKPTGRYIAKYPCTYCPYLAECQGPHEIDWVSDREGNNKPVYVFKRKETKDGLSATG